MSIEVPGASFDLEYRVSIAPQGFLIRWVYWPLSGQIPVQLTTVHAGSLGGLRRAFRSRLIECQKRHIAGLM